MNGIEEAVRTWEMFRMGTIAELENIPEEQWDFRPGAGSRTLRELALHIIAASAAFAEELMKDEPTFMRLSNPDVQKSLITDLGDLQSKAAIIELMKTRAAETAKQLREHAEELQSGTMKTMKGSQSRLTGLWFAAAHEMYHRGQLTVYERAMGEVPAMTQQMQKRSQ